MRFIKFAAILGVLSFMAFSCTQNSSSTNTTTTNGKTITQNQNGTIVSYEPATSNTSSNAAPTDELAAAKKIFTDKCINCHKETGEGGEVNIEGDTFKVPSFKNEKVIAADDAKLTRIINEGDDKMPAFKNKLKPEEIADMVKFIRKSFQGK